MAGDYTTHPRIVGIKAACEYLAKRRCGILAKWENGIWEFRIPRKVLVLFRN